MLISFIIKIEEEFSVVFLESSIIEKVETALRDEPEWVNAVLFYKDEYQRVTELAVDCARVLNEANGYIVNVEKKGEGND